MISIEKIEGLRGKEAQVQVVVKNIARKEAKEPETRSDDELRAALRVKGEQTVKVLYDLISSIDVGGVGVVVVVSFSCFVFARGDSLRPLLGCSFICVCADWLRLDETSRNSS